MMQRASSEEILLRLKENSPKNPYNFSVLALNALGASIPPNFIDQLKKHLKGETGTDFSLLKDAKFGLLRPLAPHIQVYSRFKYSGIPLVAVDENRWAGILLTFMILTLDEWVSKMYNALMFEITQLMKEGKGPHQEFFDHKPWFWGLYTAQGKDLVRTGSVYIADQRSDAEIQKFYEDVVKAWPQKTTTMTTYPVFSMKELLDKFLSGEFKVTGSAPVKYKTYTDCQELLKNGGQLQAIDFMNVCIALTQQKIIREHYYIVLTDFMKTGNRVMKIHIPDQNEIGLLTPRTPGKIEGRHSVPVFSLDHGTTWFTLMFGKVVKGEPKELIEHLKQHSPVDEVKTYDLWGLYCPSGKNMVLRREVAFQVDQMEALLSVVSEEIEETPLPANGERVQKKRSREEDGGEIEHEPDDKRPRH